MITINLKMQLLEENILKILICPTVDIRNEISEHHLKGILVSREELKTIIKAIKIVDIKNISCGSYDQDL